MARFRNLARRLFGMTCPACGGEGYYRAFSPVARLDQIRPLFTYRCWICNGRGWVWP